jgi:EAL domain-containing protein (putative c-di-GMP-specific phosphodiesterase class I)
LILDLVLGRSDAVDVIRKLEFLKFAGRIILNSGHEQATLCKFEQVGKARGLRMLPSLHKPFRVTEFRAAIQAAAESDGSVSAGQQTVIESTAAKQRILQEALDNDWLEVWYQPKIDLRLLRICGAEALVRARHPKHGIIEPAKLLPPVGDPLYKPLTLFVVKQVMADWLAFAEQGHPLKLSINVPASILCAPGFVDFIRNALPAHPKFPGLIVEVTEDEAIRDMAWIYEIATQLRLYNIWISIDDFGSAYASLSRIKDLPFREIKLDKGFVANCATDSLKRGLCQTVSELAHCFGASVCAEGVETLEDLRCLVDLGFDTAQGIVFARPMPAKLFVEFIATQQGAVSINSNMASGGGTQSSAQA